VKNEYTLHDFVVVAITVPKIIKVSKNLTKLWQKQFWLFFSETRCSTLSKTRTDVPSWNSHVRVIRVLHYEVCLWSWLQTGWCNKN